MNATISYDRFIDYIRLNALLDNWEDTKNAPMKRIKLMALINLDILLTTFPENVYWFLKKMLAIANENELEELRLIIAKARTANLQLFHKYLLDWENIAEDVSIMRKYGYILSGADSVILESILIKWKEEALEILNKW